jgi:hypothetical protein
MAGTPLAALLFEKTWFRRASIALLLPCLGVYLLAGLGPALRRLEPEKRSWLGARIARLQREHAMTVDYRWLDGQVGVLPIHEDYTRREIYQFLLSRLPQATVIGFLGSPNAEGSFVFGPGFQNKVISLIDLRVPNQTLEPPAEVQYIVVDEVDLEGGDARAFDGFDRWLEVTDRGKPLVTAFRRHDGTTR